MMCQEVIELMQRYLDQDLDEMEYEQMLGHLQLCPDCTELFQRLVALSQELEQLPKVTPAYSLVDAILPKLQRIDEGHPAIEFPGVTLPSGSGLREESVAVEQQSKVDEVAGWRKRMRGLVSTKIVGGVVAAGLVLGFFVFEQQQQTAGSKDAGQMLLPSSASQSKAASPEKQAPAADTNTQNRLFGQSSAADTMEKSDSNQMMDKKSDVTVPVTPAPEPDKAAGLVEPNKAGSIQPKSQPRDTSKSANEAQPTPSPEQQVPETSNEEPAASLSVPPVQNKAAVPPDNGSESGTKADSQAAGSSGKSETSVPSDSARGTANPSFVPNDAQGLKAPADSKEEAKGKSQDPGINGLYSVAGSAAAEKTLASQDNAYVAAITEKRQVVIRDNQGNNLFISSNQWTDKDKVELVEWTENTKLTYKVTSETAVTTYIIDMKEKTEVKK